MPDPLLMLPLAILDTAMNAALVIVGVGFLIFVHELGHFLVAKWNKVRVEAFSLGFGPVLWGFRRGDTHYRLSAIPLGGYVKMAGENPSEDHTNDPAEFQNKSVLARASILVAGVVMNAFFAVVLFVVAFNVGVPLFSPVIGRVEPGSPAWAAGLEAGDRVLRIGDTRVLDFDDIVQEVAFSSDSVDLLVQRGDEELSFPGIVPVKDAARGIRMIGIEPAHEFVVPEESEFPDSGLEPGDEFLSIGGVPTKDRGSIERLLANPSRSIAFEVRRGGATVVVDVEPKLEDDAAGRALVGIEPVRTGIGGVIAGSPAAAAGFRKGDHLVAVDGRPVSNLESAEALSSAAPGPVVFTVLRDGDKEDLPPVSSISGAPGWREFFSGLAAANFDMKETRVALIPDWRFRDGNPARAAGLEDGARILTVGGKAVPDYDFLVEAIQDTPEGEPVRLTFSVRGEERPEIAVHRRPQLRRVYGVAVSTLTEKVRVPGVMDAIQAGVRRSLLTARRILQMISAMFSGRVSAKNLGGPLAIFDMASGAANMDLIYFLNFLGILSVNLAILNILPIPILDGGHLTFLAIEAVRGKPLSERTLAAFQWLGLLVIVMLMVFVMANDVIRKWG